MDIRERNALMNKYLREARTKGIIGPYRADEYAKARLKGKSPEEAEKIASTTKR